MPTTERKRRRGTAAQNDTFTGVMGEATIDTTNLRWRLHDQVSPGGMVIPNLRDSQNQAFLAAVAGGTANALTLDFGAINNPAAYAKFQRFVFEAADNNTATATLNVGSLGNVGLRKIDNTGAKQELEEDDIVAGIIYQVTHDGSHFVLGAAASGSGGGRVLLAESTATGGATIDFTSGIDATYDIYEIELIGLNGSSTGNLIMQFSSNGGSSWLATLYDHGRLNHVFSEAATSQQVISTTSMLLASGLGSAANTRDVHAQIILHGLPNANSYSHAIWEVMTIDNGTGNGYRSLGSGVQRSAAAINAVRITPPGNVDQVTARLWGWSKT